MPPAPQGINILNIQRTQKTQYQKPNNPINKWAKEQTFLKRNTNGQQIHAKMFNIPSNQGNANQNHIDISSRCSQNSNHREHKQ